MAVAQDRDFTNLKRSDLLDDYVFRSKNRKGALVATALRTRSVSMRDVLVYQAFGPDLSYAELVSTAQTGTLQGLHVKDYLAVSELGRLVLLQNILPSDLALGESLIRMALSSNQKTKVPVYVTRCLVQSLVHRGEIESSRALLDEFESIDAEDFQYLRAETYNPFGFGNDEDTDKWLKLFNRPFVEANLSPIQIHMNSESVPFDSMYSRVENGRPSENSEAERDLVSVVLTAYKPTAASLITSVNSVLNQTWKNLELIIVDDCSGDKYSDLFDEIGALDPRVRIIRSELNRGTYVARNIGYSAARGIFITGQDDDDWSHPERIEAQVQFMRENEHTIGCRVQAIRCDNNLSRVRVGYRPISENASSLLIRREAFQRAGGFLEARKAADTEFFHRISKITGQPVGLLDKPLSVIRIMAGSLSRSEFSPGWRHTARRSFRSAYEYWHENSNLEELQLQPGRKPAVEIPSRFQVVPGEASEEFDVVLAGDWQQYGGPQKSMIEEIHALKKANYRVGIMNFEVARFMTKSDRKNLNPVIQSMINEGYVKEVHYDDQIDVQLLVLRYPPILQFFTHDISNLNVKRMIILANQAPSELDGRDIRYLVDECDQTARRSFRVDPIWVPQGPQVRDFLEQYLGYPKLANFDLPGILDLDEWWHSRLWFRSRIPVIGRHSRDNAMKWPSSAEVVESVYPLDGSADVRIMGGAKSAYKVLGIDSSPVAWTVYRTDELPVPEFLYMLDYFVFYQHEEAVEAFGRAILEALASGAVVILPKQFERVFGEAAIYCEPEEVMDNVLALHSDFGKYQEQLSKAEHILSGQFSHKSYVRSIETILSQTKVSE